MEIYMGSIQAFGFGFTPRGWLSCQGQLLEVSQYQALFSLLGTTYGGDGRKTFSLPDLRSRSPIGQGKGNGLSDRRLGERGGSETNVLNANQMPAHSHAIDFSGQNVKANIEIPSANSEGIFETSSGNVLANIKGGYALSTSANTNLSGFKAEVGGTAQTSSAGSGSAINNMQPFLALNYCICLDGVYPSRS